MADHALDTETPAPTPGPPSRRALARHRTLPLSLTALLATLLIACGSSAPPPGSDPSGGIAPGEPVVFDAGGDRERARFQLTNTADQPLSWSLDVVWNPDDDNPQSGPWFDYQPASGTIAAGGAQTLTLTLRSGLAPGGYRADLFVDYGSGRTPFEVRGQVGAGDPEPDFDIRLARSELTLAPGADADVEVELIDVTEPISVEVDRAPAGVAAEIVDNGDPNDTVVLLRLAASGSAKSGEVVVVARAESGGSRRATLQLTVESTGSGAGTLRGSVSTVNADVPVAPPSGLAVPAAALGSESAAERPAYVAGQLLVAYADDGATPERVRDGAGERLETAAEARARRAAELRRSYRLELLRESGPGRADLLRVPAGRDPLELAAELARDPRVRYAEPNWLVYPFGAPTDPEAGRLWQLPIAGLPLAWEARRSSAAVVVAVVDSGFALDHEDLQGAFASGGYDFCNAFDGSTCSTDDDVTPSATSDRHGTHVAGLVAARGDNGRGVAGAIPGAVQLLPVKVFESYGQPTPVATVADAIRWAAGEAIDGVANPDPADVINLSLGLDADSQVLREAVEAAQGRGALLIAAAGNSAPTRDTLSRLAYPARYPGVVSVGSVNSRLQRSCFSRYPGDGVKRAEHVMLPGGDAAELDPAAAGQECPGRPSEALLSTVPGGYGTLTGTSQAAPIGSGIAALIWAQQGAGASAGSVRSALLAATWLPDGAAGREFGRGVLRADLALGFPGPDAAVSVDASGPGSAAAVVRLDPFGGSSGFEFRDLPSGSYTLEAVSEDAARPLRARATAVVADGETRTVRPRLTP